jgi:hypothetical protein
LRRERRPIFENSRYDRVIFSLFRVVKMS